jgi:hypothetical protein
MTIKDIIKFFDPLTALRDERKAWLDTVTLPEYKPSHEVRCLNCKPGHIHPLIDPYITSEEAYQLLLRYGYVEEYQGKYIGLSAIHIRKILDSYIKEATFMKGLRDELKVSYTGE